MTTHAKRISWLLLFGGLLSGCAIHEPRPVQLYEGNVITFDQAPYMFFPCHGTSIKHGWTIVRRPPELVGSQASMYHLRCLGSATPHGKPFPDGAPGTPLFQPRDFRVERVLEFRPIRRSDCD